MTDTVKPWPIRYDSTGLPAYEGDVTENGWEIVRQRALNDEPAPNDDELPPEFLSRPCARARCKHLAPYYGKHCPIHATKGEYER